MKPGIVIAEVVDIETLADRLRAEIVTCQGRTLARACLSLGSYAVRRLFRYVRRVTYNAIGWPPRCGDVSSRF